VAAVNAEARSTPAALSIDDRDSVWDRLIRAADAALQRDGADGVSIDAVAAEAGVSRATAFRQLGKREDMIVAVALVRSRRYTGECAVLMGRHTGVIAKLEAAFVHLVRELSSDPIVRFVFASRAPDDLGPGVHEEALAILGPVIEGGRAAGEIRTDVSVDQIIDWTVEQLYLALQKVERSEAAVVYRVQMFLAPALAADRERLVSSQLRSRIETLDAALQQGGRALDSLRAELRAAAARDG